MYKREINWTTLHSFENKAIPVLLKSATLNFYKICVSDGSCLCEACIFLKHITCVNFFYETHNLRILAICIYSTCNYR